MNAILALGAGAALGWAHIGVIRALERAGIGIVGIAGCSMGAIVGAAHASGRSAGLEDFARRLTRPAVLRRLSPLGPRGGLIDGALIGRLLAPFCGGFALEDAALPLAVQASDLGSGAPVVLREGDALAAVRASIAIPALLPPVRIGGRWLADGGVLVPVPVGAARALGTAPVVAVNVLGDYPGRARRLGYEAAAAPSSLRGASAGFGLVMARLARLMLEREPPDLLIEPPLGRFGPEQFHRAAALIAEGEAAADAALPALAGLARR